MEHEAEPGPTEAVGQDPAGTGLGTGSETAPAEAGEVTSSAAVPEGAVGDGAADVGNDAVGDAADGEVADGPAEVGNGAAGNGEVGEVAVEDGADGAAAGRAAAANPPETTTGEARVDAALELLDRLSELPVSDHPELFEQVHARLSEVLGELESGPDATGPASG